MNPPRKRSFATSLTDDELALLDVLFFGGVKFRHLRQSVFLDHWNCYPHQLDDLQLKETLDRLCTSGILEREEGTRAHGEEYEGYFYITSEGGSLWESERTPIWDRFAMDWYRGWAPGRQTLLILAVSENIRDDFWRIGSHYMRWTGNPARVRFCKAVNHKNRTLLDWKPFPAIYAAIAIIDDDSRDPHWGPAYEAERTWWRDIFELQKFLPPV